jgi:hypothetical protein
MGDRRRDKSSFWSFFWSFWTTLPGILKAAAALIAAVTALIGALVAAGIIRPDGDNGPTPTPPVTASVARTSTPSAVRIPGKYKLRDWVETPYGQVTLYMEVKSGTLDVDDVGHAVWDLALNQIAEDFSHQPELRCLGTIANDTRTLRGTTPLNVGGVQLKQEERDWTSNMESIRRDLFVAFCGFSLESSTTYERDRDDFRLEWLSLDGGRPFLRMTNIAGVLTWEQTE